jgi:phage tail sheath gpL-like
MIKYRENKLAEAAAAKLMGKGQKLHEMVKPFSNSAL